LKLDERKTKAEEKLIQVKSRIRHSKNEIRKLERGVPIPSLPEEETQEA